MTTIKKVRTSLLAILSLVLVVSAYLYIRANNENKTLIHKSAIYYTPGQNDNCKWVFHISQDLIDLPGAAVAVQIGIPEAEAHGYIEGLLEVTNNNTLILAFNFPGRAKSSPPLLMTSSYNINKLPLNSLKFRIFNSTAMVMNLYDSYESCVESVMR